MSSPLHRTPINETFDEVKADRRHWRHEYRIEKQKNVLLESDRRHMREAISEMIVGWDREHFTDEVGEDLIDAVEHLRHLVRRPGDR